MWNKALFAVILKTGVFLRVPPAMKLTNARLSHFANRRLTWASCFETFNVKA